MCLTPLHIGNPTRRFVKGLSRPLITVACGHCKECIQRQQDDWFVRSVFESKRVQSRGGAVWFPTLTYNNENIPWWNDPKHNFSCPCFDVTHFKKFRDKLRTYLKRLGYDCSGDNTIRYIYCCEYGGKRGRSHIHCLLYVPFRVPSKVMHDLLQKCWTYGFVMWSKKGMIAQGLKASQYCMKYLAKEMSWYKQYKIDEYMQTLHDDIYKAYKHDDLEAAYSAEQLLKDFRHVTPGHKQSMGFGIDGVDYFKDSDGAWNIDSLVDGRFSACRLGIPPTKKGQNMMYNMPMYYVRKIFYNIDEWKLYRMNELGKEIFSLRFDLSLKRKAESYQPYLQTSAWLREHLAPLGLPGSDVDKLFEELRYKMDGRTADDLALFDIVYRDIEGVDDPALPGYNECLIAHLYEGQSNRECLDFLREVSFDFMLAQKSIDIVPRPAKIRYSKENKKRGEVTFNDVPPFKYFAEVLGTIEEYEHNIGKLAQEAYVTERLRQENLFGTEGAYTSNYLFEEL